jgi:hypothetical protein
MNGQELIWVPVELKEAWEKATSEEEQKKIFFKAVDDRKLDIKNQIECLEDELLIFKGIGLRYKTELEKVYEEQSDKAGKIWETFNAGDKLFNQAKAINDSLRPVASTINEINEKLSAINTYKIENAITLIEKFNCMSEGTKGMFKLLINNEKGD